MSTRRVLFVASALLALGCSVAGAFNDWQTTNEKLVETIDRIAQEEIASKRTAGLTIAINRGGKTLVAKGYGLADLQHQVPATADTVYRIASNTKQFTAAAIVQLQAAGKLHLEATLTELLPEYPAPTKPITVRNLLQHTSGIPDYRRDRPEDATHADVIAEFDKLPLEFDPGTQWKYSNSNYYLLGMIVERVSGETYSNYLARHIFAPAGMSNTSLDAHFPVVPHRASGYFAIRQGFVNARWVSMTRNFSAAGLQSTAHDLVAWQRALAEHRLQPPDLYERMTTDLAETRLPDGKRYGYGLEEVRRPEGLTFGHGGGVYGFTSVIIYFPDSQDTLVILSNTQNYVIDEVMGKIRKAMFAKQ